MKRRIKHQHWADEIHLITCDWNEFFIFRYLFFPTEKSNEKLSVFFQMCFFPHPQLIRWWRWKQRILNWDWRTVSQSSLMIVVHDVFVLWSASNVQLIWNSNQISWNLGRSSITSSKQSSVDAKAIAITMHKIASSARQKPLMSYSSSFLSYRNHFTVRVASIIVSVDNTNNTISCFVALNLWFNDGLVALCSHRTRD